MRLVFAGTPDVALPSLRALLDSRHEVVAVVTRPDAPAGRGRRLAPSPVAELAAEHGLEMLKPAKAGDPEFLDRLRAIGPDCCPVVAYGALLPGGRARRPAARLGQPALLGAAGLAGRRPGPAVADGRRRGDRRDDVPARQGAGRRTDVRAVHRAHPRRRHRRSPAGPAGRVRRRAARDHPGRHRGRRARGARAGPRAGVVRPEADRRGGADRLDPAGVRGRPPHPRLHAVPGRLDDHRRPAGEDRAPRRHGRSATSSAPATWRWASAAVLVGTGTHALELGEVQPAGKPRMRAADWARGLHTAPARLGT